MINFAPSHRDNLTNFWIEINDLVNSSLNRAWLNKNLGISANFISYNFITGG